LLLALCEVFLKMNCCCFVLINSLHELTTEQVKKSLDDEASVFMMFASLKESSEKGVGDFPVVQEFP